MSPSGGEKLLSRPVYSKSGLDHVNNVIDGFILTQMASLALFPSIASVFTLKSTPKKIEAETLIDQKVFFYVLYASGIHIPIVAANSGSNVSSVNLRRRLEKKKVEIFTIKKTKKRLFLSLQRWSQRHNSDVNKRTRKLKITNSQKVALK